MAYKIQQLGLGGVLDQAIAIIKDHFGLFTQIMLLMLIPFNLVVGFITLAYTSQINEVAAAENVELFEQMQPFMTVFFVAVVFLNFLLVIPATNAAVIQAVARLYLGQPITALEAMKHGLRRLVPLIFTTFLMYLAIWLGLLLLIIPGIYLAIWFGLSQQVVVIEGISGPQALGRSRKLVHPFRGKFLALGIVLMIITVLLTVAGEAIPQPHTRIIVSTLLEAVTTLFWTAALVVFYFSCRCAYENFDLHYLAETITEEPPPEEAPPTGFAT